MSENGKNRTGKMFSDTRFVSIPVIKLRFARTPRQTPASCGFNFDYIPLIILKCLCLSWSSMHDRCLRVKKDELLTSSNWLFGLSIEHEVEAREWSISEQGGTQAAIETCKIRHTSKEIKHCQNDTYICLHDSLTHFTMTFTWFCINKLQFTNMLINPL